MPQAAAPQSWLDVLFWALVLFPVAMGFVKGFVRQIVPLVGLFVAFTAASRYYPAVHQKAVAAVLDGERVGHAVAFGLVFFGVTLLFSALAFGLDKVVKVAMLGWLNRALGAGAGLLKGGVYALILAYGVVMFASKDSPAVKASRWVPGVVSFAESTLWPLIPEKDRKDFAEKKEKLLAFLKDEAAKTAERGKDGVAQAVAGKLDAARDKAEAAGEKAGEARDEAAEAVKRVVDETLPSRR